MLKRYKIGNIVHRCCLVSSNLSSSHESGVLCTFRSVCVYIYIYMRVVSCEL